MRTTQPWLPPGTAMPAALHAWLAACVEGWSRKWFAGDPLALNASGTGASGQLNWRSIDDGLMLGSASGALTTIGARVMAIPSADRESRDRTLIEEVGGECVRDLEATLATLIEGPRPGDWLPVLAGAPSRLATIGGPRGPLCLGLSDAVFAKLVGRALPPPALAPLGSGAAALCATMVSVAAAIGRSSLTLADLRALTVGDVVVLDRPTTEPVAVAVDGRALVRGRVEVLAGDPHPILRVVEAVL